MTKTEERIRLLEIDQATTKQSIATLDARVKRSMAETEQLALQTYRNKEQLDKWGGGVTLLVKAIAIICTLIGMIIAAIEFASAESQSSQGYLSLSSSAYQSFSCLQCPTCQAIPEV